MEGAWFSDPFKIDESSNYGEVWGADSKSEICFFLSDLVTEIWLFKRAKFVTQNSFLRNNSKTQHDTQKVTSDLKPAWSIILRSTVWSHSETFEYFPKINKTSRLTPCVFFRVKRGHLSNCLGTFMPGGIDHADSKNVTFNRIATFVRFQEVKRGQMRPWCLVTAKYQLMDNLLLWRHQLQL